ncbi:MAG: BglG family transcription antiterminator [Pseudolactococcus laudensis]
MLVTKREQQIIDEIVKKGQVSIAELLDVVGVSRRTLYRDLQNLQDFLPNYQVSLIKIDQFYSLKGELSNLTDKRVVEDYTQNERHFMELILLIFEQAKLADFMSRFAISQPTATNDLKIIEKNLTFAGNGLVREGGLEVIASEYSKRTLLVSCLVSNLSTRDIFNFSDAIYQENKVVQLFQKAYFESVTIAFERSKISNISDRTQGILRLFFIVTLERLGQQHLIENHYQFRPSKKALDFVTKIVQNLPDFRLNLPEIMYLSHMVDVLHFDKGGNFLFNEKYDTSFSYKVRQFIEDVSVTTGLNFSRDEKIFALLNTHLRSSFTLPQLFSDDKNDLVIRVQEEHARLFKVISRCLADVFDKKFSKHEVALITLHFLATLERSSRVFPMTALLITSRGRVSMAILARNLQTQFLFITSIKIIQVSQMHQEDLSHFDIIFTTEKIEDDAKELSSESFIQLSSSIGLSNVSGIARDIRKLRVKRTPRPQNDTMIENPLDFQDFFLKSQVILQNFSISELTNIADFNETIYDLMRADNLIDWDLLERFKRTSFGIPKTNLVLIHGISKVVPRPEFKIFDLTQEIEVMGMDKEPMTANRILFLTAPQSIDEIYNYILGKISSSIIENPLYTTIYSSGNYEIVYELLNKIIGESFTKYTTEEQ